MTDGTREKKESKTVTSILPGKYQVPQRQSDLFKVNTVLITGVFHFCRLLSMFCQELRLLGWDAVYTSGLINFELSVQPKEYHYAYMATSRKCN